MNTGTEDEGVLLGIEGCSSALNADLCFGK
jgi:hypothetical protein